MKNLIFVIALTGALAFAVAKGWLFGAAEQSVSEHIAPKNAAFIDVSTSSANALRTAVANEGTSNQTAQVMRISTADNDDQTARNTET